MLAIRLKKESKVTENYGISSVNQMRKSGRSMTQSFFGGGDIQAKMSGNYSYSK